MLLLLVVVWLVLRLARPQPRHAAMPLEETAPRTVAPAEPSEAMEPEAAEAEGAEEPEPAPPAPGAAPPRGEPPEDDGEFIFVLAR